MVSVSKSNSDEVNCNNESKNESKNEVFISSSRNITGRQSLLILPIIRFFNESDNLNVLIPILDGTSKISLRLIDWFVTNFCKKNNTLFNKLDYLNSVGKECIDVSNSCKSSFKNSSKNNTKSMSKNTTSKNINKNNNKNKNYRDFNNFIIVHNDYKSQLKSYSKRNFDPFCRRNRIKFYYEPAKYFITTVGQLNFFKWAIENYIINYITQNFDDIENDMNLRLNNDKSKRNRTSSTSSIGSIGSNSSQTEESSNTKKKSTSKLESMNNKRGNTVGGTKKEEKFR